MLKGVDASAGTVTISLSERREAATDKSYTLAKDVEVAIDTGGGRRGFLKAIKLADMPMGTPVMLTLSADESTVEFIMAEGPMVRGQLKSVDAAKNTITVQLPPTRRDESAEQEAKTYSLTSNAEVAVDDGRGRRFSIKEAQLADLVPGSLVTLWLTLDQKQALAVLAEGQNLNGRVKAIDAAKNTLTLVIRPERGEPEERVLDIAPDAMVLLDDGRGRRLSLKEGKLADVPVGAAAMLKLAPNQITVMQLRAQGPSVPGMIKAIDLANSTITIATRVSREDPPEEKSYPVAKDATIVIDGEQAKLDAIKVADDGPFAMLRLSLDQKTVQAITVGRGGR
jgi:hypothetical protein